MWLSIILLIVQTATQHTNIRRNWSHKYQGKENLTSGFSTPSHWWQLGISKSCSQNFSSISISPSGRCCIPKLLSEPGCATSKLSIASAHCRHNSNTVIVSPPGLLKPSGRIRKNNRHQFTLRFDSQVASIIYREMYSSTDQQYHLYAGAG